MPKDIILYQLPQLCHTSKRKISLFVQMIKRFGTHVFVPWRSWSSRPEYVQIQVRIQDLVKGGAPASEAESCRRSEAESREWSEHSVAGGPGPA